VKAIHAATNLALGFTRRMNTPLIMIPRPMTRIPPTPVKEINHSYKHLITVVNISPVMVLTWFLASAMAVSLFYIFNFISA
jgi:hypothetical protein